MRSAATRLRPPVPVRGPDRQRVFLALWPEAAARADLAVWRDRQTWPASARPTPDDKLHLTLHFLGSQPLARVAALAEALPPPPAAFALSMSTVQVWRGGLVVLCPREIPDALAAWHAQLAQLLQQLHLPVESRPFRPHVTLARDALPRLLPVAGEPTAWIVRQVSLVQSLPDGRYRVLRHGPAAADDSG